MAEPLFRSTRPAAATAIVTDARILGGMPVLSGTRIPAEIIAAYLRAGFMPADIEADYPSLPAHWISAVEAWAAAEYGRHWKSTVTDTGS